LASTPNIYGNNPNSPISEQALPAPVSHYGMSKLAMEYLYRPFLEQFPIVIVRPFNYTGVGHDSRFVIPKIVECFRAKRDVVELGNIDVLREYNDVRDVCDIYLKLLKLGKSGQAYNLASGRSHSLREVISLLGEIAGHDIEVVKSPQFMRANEIFQLTGDATRLQECIGPVSWRSLKETLHWMYAAKQ
jgi:nucleoside-diphosphate-sugar epimerase